MRIKQGADAGESSLSPVPDGIFLSSGWFPVVSQDRSVWYWKVIVFYFVS